MVIEKLYESKINEIESKTLAEVKVLTTEIISVKSELKKANQFNKITRLKKKYLDAPIAIINKELKEQYQ